MAKMVGLNVSIKMGWMKKAVELLEMNPTEKEYKDRLKEYLSFEIDSPTNLRKATDNLTNIWYRDTEEFTPLQQEGRKLAQEHPDCISAIGWCMIPMAYPVFYDLGKLMGKMYEFQDVITTSQIRQKMFDEWGERSTLDYSVSKVIAAMKSLEAIWSPQTGRYRSCSIKVVNEDVVSFIVRVSMKLDGSSYYPFSSLSEFPFLFPFKYRVYKEQLMQNDSFSLSTFDATLSVALKW